MQKALFLYNPAAGRGRIACNVGGIVDIFSENGWELTPEKIDFGRNPFDAHPDIRMVVAAGGDGTVNYVVNRMRERGLSLELGIIPAGTANDFAGIVGIQISFNEHLSQCRSYFAFGITVLLNISCISLAHCLTISRNSSVIATSIR